MIITALLFCVLSLHSENIITVGVGCNNKPDAPKCSKLAQCADCSDESFCPNLKSCEPNNGCKGFGQQYFTHDNGPDNEHCDGKIHCNNCYDEKECNSSKLFFCSNGEGCVDFGDSTSCSRTSGAETCPLFCDGTPHCSDKSDEQTEGFGFKCTAVSNTHSEKSVAEFPSCIVPQQYIERWKDPPVNITSACLFNADDCWQVVDNKPQLNSTKCWMCLNGLIIQRSQVCDGIFDCPDLSDECLCEGEEECIQQQCKELLENREHCSVNEVACSPNGCIDTSKIFENGSRCLNPKCSPSKNMKNYSCTTSDGDGELSAIKCNGYIDCRFNAEDECLPECENKPEFCKYISLLDSGLRWEELSNCSGIYAVNLCDKVNDCGDGIDERFCPNLERCDKNDPESIYYDKNQRCNYVIDCPNKIDEKNCNHIECDNGEKYLQPREINDGKYDCKDLSDECPLSVLSNHTVSSRTELIGNVHWYAVVWCMMILSLVGNTIVIIKTSRDIAGMLRRRLNYSSNRIGVCNKTMLLNLAFSDLLMGFYLFYIVVVSLKYSGKYCVHFVNWLSSSQCSFLGVVSMLSCQTSVLIMTLMTSYRLYGVINPFRAEKIRCKVIIVALAFIWLIALVVAVAPVIPWNTDFFTTYLVIYEPYLRDVLISRNRLADFLTNVTKLPGSHPKVSPQAPFTLETFCSIFDDNSTRLSVCDKPEQATTIGYYGTDAVCIPRYYGEPNDPSSNYTLGIIIFDFIAFSYMLIAYAIIYVCTSKGKGSRGSEADLRVQENRALWMKIVRLILTNLVCWLPVCILCFLSYNRVDVTAAYPFTALLLLPVNSAANPWIYSSFLLDYVKKWWHSKNFFKKFCFFKRTMKTTDRNKNKPPPKISTHNNKWCGLLGNRKISQDQDLPMTPNSPSSIVNLTNDGLTMQTEL